MRQWLVAIHFGFLTYMISFSYFFLSILMSYVIVKGCSCFMTENFSSIFKHGNIFGLRGSWSIENHLRQSAWRQLSNSYFNFAILFLIIDWKVNQIGFVTVLTASYNFKNIFLKSWELAISASPPWFLANFYFW